MAAYTAIQSSFHCPCSFHMGRSAIFLIRAAHDDPDRIRIRQRSLQRFFASSHGARIHTSRSSSGRYSGFLPVFSPQRRPHVIGGLRPATDDT